MNRSLSVLGPGVKSGPGRHAPRPPMPETPEWSEPPPVRRAIRGARRTGPSARDGRMERSRHRSTIRGRSDDPSSCRAAPSRARSPGSSIRPNCQGARRPARSPRPAPGPDVEAPESGGRSSPTAHQASTAGGRGALRTNDRAMSGRRAVTADCETGPRIARAGAVGHGKPAEPRRIWVRFGDFGVQTRFPGGSGANPGPRNGVLDDPGSRQGLRGGWSVRRPPADPREAIPRSSGRP